MFHQQSIVIIGAAIKNKKISYNFHTDLSLCKAIRSAQ